MTARLVAMVLLAAGLATGAATDSAVVAQPQRDGDDWILAADFHVHAFAGDIGLLPWDIQREAERRGLDVLAVTNHTGIMGSLVNRWWAKRADGPLVLVAQEVTGANYHLTALGLQRSVTAAQPAAGAIRDIHAQGGLAIAAHPGRVFWPGYDEQALATLDGVEVAHPAMMASKASAAELTTFYGLVRARQAQAAAIGGSDFHILGPLGLTRTFVFARERSEAGVLAAIREGRTVASGMSRLYGDAGLVERVREYIRHRPAASVRGTQERLSVILALTGLLALALTAPAGRLSAGNASRQEEQ